MAPECPQHYDLSGLASTLAFAQSRLRQVQAAIADGRDYTASAGLQECSRMIAAFYEKNGMAHGYSLPPVAIACQESNAAVLHERAARLREASQQALKAYEESLTLCRDPRQLRDHLIEEELAELLDALGTGNEVDALDALADLLYVVIGTATAFDLPVWDAFVEVHRSNMTKERANGDPALRKEKGDGYSPPDIAGVLRRYREAQAAERK